MNWRSDCLLATSSLSCIFGDDNMLDLQFVCDNLELIRTNCAERRAEADLERIVELRNSRTALITEGDRFRHEQKEIAAKIPKAAPGERPALVERGKDLKTLVGQNELSLKEVEQQLRDRKIGVEHHGSIQRATSSTSSTPPPLHFSVDW